MKTSSKSSSAVTVLKHCVPGLPILIGEAALWGVSAQSLAKLAQRGALKRLGRGAYCLPNDPINALGAAAVLMKMHPDIHAGGLTALHWQGIRHSVPVLSSVELCGTQRLQIPSWLKTLEVHYRITDLFDFSDEKGRALDVSTVCTCPGMPFELRCSVPERAFLEYLALVCRGGITTAGWHDALAVMDSLVYPRRAVLGNLMSRCRSVQVNRTFCRLARRAPFLGFPLTDFVTEFNIRHGNRPLKLTPLERDLDDF